MKKFGMVLLPVFTIILELLPHGAVLIFAPSPADTIRETYAYFSLEPVGYANFAPFVTAFLTCIILILAIITIIKNDMKVGKALFITSLVAVMVSLVPLRFGIDYYSIIGGMITVMLVVECILAKAMTK